MAPSSRWLPLARKLATRVPLVFGGLWLAYLCVANALLGSGWLQGLIHDAQDQVEIRYDRAWTVFPTRIHIEGLELGIEDSAIQARLVIDEATADLQPLGLLRRDFSVRRVRAGTTSFWIRRRVPLADLGPHRMRGIPPIPGMDAPVKHPSLPALAPPDGWRVHIEDVRTHLHDLWIDQHRFIGSTTLEGRLDFTPEQSIEAAATATTVRGALVVADQLLVHHLEGALTATLDETDLQGDDAEAELVARASLFLALEQAAAYLPGAGAYLATDGVRVTAGLARARGTVMLAQGFLLPPTRLDLHLSGLRVVTAPRWDVLLSGDASLTALGGQARLRLQLDEPAGSAAIVVERGKVQAFASPQLLGAFGLDALDLTLIARAPDLQSLQRVAGDGSEDEPRIVGGSGRAKVALHVRRGSGEPQVRAKMYAEASGAGLRWQDRHFRADLKANAALEGAPSSLRGTGVRLQVSQLAVGQVGEELERQEDWQGWLKLHGLTLETGPPLRLQAVAHGKLTSAEPLLTLPPLDDAIPDVLVSLVDLDDVQSRLGIFVNGSAREIKIYCLDADGVALRGRLLTGDVAMGAFWIEKGPMHWGVDIGPRNTEVLWFPGDDFGQAHARLLGPEPENERCFGAD